MVLSEKDCSVDKADDVDDVNVELLIWDKFGDVEDVISDMSQLTTIRVTRNGHFQQPFYTVFLETFFGHFISVNRHFLRLFGLFY